MQFKAFRMPVTLATIIKSRKHRPGTSIKVEMTNRAHVTCDAGAFDD